MAMHLGHGAWILTAEEAEMEQRLKAIRKAGVAQPFIRVAPVYEPLGWRWIFRGGGE